MRAPCHSFARPGLFAVLAVCSCGTGGGDGSVTGSQAATGAAPAAASLFGLTTSDDFYTVNTGAGLVFKVRRTDDGSSTRSPGDIASLVFNGVEYQDEARGSQINSGFDYLYTGVSAVNVSAALVGTDAVQITVTAGDLVHYYLARSGEPYIAMATYFASEPDTLGMCRYIVRIASALLPNGPDASDIRDTITTVEASDVFALPNGQTRSKHYSNRRLIDWTYTGASGQNVGIWMVRDRGEGGSGGPFYRSLINQGAADQEIYEITNYAEAQTEAYRTGVLDGPYALAFTEGGAPAPLDLAWIDALDLKGSVGAAGRGRIAGVGIAGRDTRYAYTVGLANSTAQYWTGANPANGDFEIASVRAGIYAMTIYKGELAVDTRSVTIAAGGATALNTITLANDPSFVSPIFRIGDWDGTPHEFLNGDKVTTMHPSDPRMAAWTVPGFVVGHSPAATSFPAYQWQAINNPITVSFDLTSAQVAAHTVRVGITTAFSNGRPRVTVNGWTSPIPTPSKQPSSRTLTIGSYRGNNTTFQFDVPASAFVAGANTMTISTISGSGASGFLSAGVSFDAIDLY